MAAAAVADGSVPRPVSSVTPLPGLSVFLPCHNEEANVERTVNGLLGALGRIAREGEVIVVDDGSRDRTGEIAERLAAANPRVKVVHHLVNRGYGGAVISGILASKQPYVLLCDGDGQFDPSDLELLVPKIAVCDVVVGWRRRRADPLMRRVNGKAWTTLVRVLFGIRLHDIDCGFKLFKRQCLDGLELRSRGAMISTELMARLAAGGARICEVEVRHLPRSAGEQSGANFKVIVRAFVELFMLFGELRAEQRRRGVPH